MEWNEFDHLLLNTKIHPKSPLLAPVLNHLDLDHSLVPYFFKIHFNIILPSKSRFAK
jgi:hypothetical protein